MFGRGIEALLYPSSSSPTLPFSAASGQASIGSVSSGVRWEVKKGEKVGFIDFNGVRKTTQLCIISGLEEPNSGNVATKASTTKSLPRHRTTTHH